MSKFKVGDKVRIVKIDTDKRIDTIGQCLKNYIGTTAVIDKIFEKDTFYKGYLYGLKDISWWAGEDELELVESTDINNNTDTINNPSHYQLNGLDIESIDIIKSILGEEGFYNFCYGNVIKYIIRADKKNGIEDIKKAQKYISWMLE